ncbi:HvfC/BufC N-terminal domain-containing protein [Roseiarcus sp.]|uniref:HvfC/BufC N-terminal domain-containing protein n=1 Tax=Roseiarcus sp. TaxID=1969460 RepID=UPI003F9D45BF
MPPWPELQRAFAAALLNPAVEPSREFVGPDREASERRFAVYRNNVVVGLIDAIGDNFPVTRRIVGEDFFRAMARAYVTAEPPRSPVLLDYGETFPDFVAAFEPADPLPYLADVARIERAWTEAYHAADAQPLTAEAFAPLTPCDAVGLRLLVHPSLRVVRSRLPAVTVWRMNVADGVPKPVDFEAGGEDGLVLPPEADVEVRVCAPGGAEFVDALAARLTLAEAAEAALRADDRFDLSANLVALIAMGAFVGAEEVNRKATSN